MSYNATAFDRLWQRRGGRGLTTVQMQDEAWMRVHEASPALYLDLLGERHGAPDVDPTRTGPGRDGRRRRLLGSLGRPQPAGSRPAPLRPEAKHA